ncbi:MAG: acyltransferase [Lautropia sp.]|nr:acyltransferase [Lautropia sp.]
MIRSIEGLRGLAALMVVFFHAYVLGRWGGTPATWGLVQNAWLFVDLFFVISGVIMAAVYGGRLHSGTQLRGFFIKRFFRLYPLHLVTTLTAIGASIFVQSSKWGLAQFGIQLGGEKAFAADFFSLPYFILELVMLQGVGIMTEALHNYPSWSLSVEFWIYLIFACLFFKVRSIRARLWISAATVVACLVYFVQPGTGLPARPFTSDVHGLPRGLLSFFLGVLIWYGWERIRGLSARQPVWVLSLIQLATTAVALWLVGIRGELGALVYAIPFAFGALVWSVLPDRGGIATLLQSRPLQWLGVHSYSIYLVHVTVLTIFEWPGRRFDEPFKYVILLVFVVAVFIASMISYRWIEVPWRERGRQLADSLNPENRLGSDEGLDPGDRARKT